MTAHILHLINGNIAEWRACFGSAGGDTPRLPLPYAFGAALAREGFALSALELGNTSRPVDVTPFREVFPSSAFDAACASVDCPVLWGMLGVQSCLKEALVPRKRRKTALFSYVWQSTGPVQPSRRVKLLLTRQAARFARAVILMTARQVQDAKRALPQFVPVVRLRVGIDSFFYREPSSEDDVPLEHRGIADRLSREPFLILPGDELRLNADLLDIVEGTGVLLVRISQYGHKSGTDALKREVARRKLGDRIIVLERISYRFLRFLLQRAAAFAGLVDASWQPAGWTALCESLASGTPLILYEGLTAGELRDLNAPQDIVESVPLGDRAAFANAVMRHGAARPTDERRRMASDFARERLDLETTAAEFARDLRHALNRS